MMIIWCMVPGIWSMTDIFLSLWASFCPFTAVTTPRKSKLWKIEISTWRYVILHVYYKWWSYDVWFLRYGMWQTGFFVILDHFLPYYPPNNPENQNFDKMKKIVGDNIILHMCTKDPNHTKYGSWDTESDIQFFCHFGPFFCPFIPLITWKIKILKKWKKHLELSSFYTCVPNIICYTVLFLRYSMWQM